MYSVHRDESAEKVVIHTRQTGVLTGLLIFPNMHSRVFFCSLLSHILLIPTKRALRPRERNTV